MIAVFTSEGLLRVDGHNSCSSGKEREGDDNKSEDLFHGHSFPGQIARYQHVRKIHSACNQTFA